MSRLSSPDGGLRLVSGLLNSPASRARSTEPAERVDPELAERVEGRLPDGGLVIPQTCWRTLIAVPLVAGAALWPTESRAQWGPYPPYYGRLPYDDTGSARLHVTPRNTQVYVDGYYVGVADDFDGYLQRLHVQVGQHELQFHLEGHRTFTQKVLFVRGTTLKIAHTMQPFAAGETSGPPPTPDETRRAQPYRGAAGPRSGPPSRPRPGELSPFGSLLLRVRPSDAAVLVDGETWNAPQGEDQFVIELAEGPHRIEVRKEGHRTYSATIRVRRGETVRLNVSLTTGGPSAVSLVVAASAGHYKVNW